MDGSSHVANTPAKPMVLYDGDCGFCKLWIRRWQQSTGDAVDYIAFQDGRTAQLFPELSCEQLAAAVHLIQTDGAVYQGAEAVFRLLAVNPSRQWPLHLYQEFPPAARATEGAYRVVAGHRMLFSRLTRMLWGRHVERAEHFLVRRIFLACLGLIYLIAFVSLWVQVTGLIGKNGISPAADMMSQAHQGMDASGIGIDRYRLLPTLCWFDVSDNFLRFQCAAGTVLAGLLVIGLAPPVCLALLWLLYLSLSSVGGDFLAFQWDCLLLEAGLLAIFFAPCQLFPRPSREKPPSRLALWLLRLLLFKLMFLSGMSKLASHDPTWRNLTALTYHYETQPLPTWIGWYAHLLPLWFQKASCAMVFVIELGAPFLIFTPRRIRMTGAFALIGLQVLILLTGNYTFFNWLALALCLLLFDDFALAKILPRSFTVLVPPPISANRPWRWRWLIVTPLAVVFVVISTFQIRAMFGPPPGWTAPVAKVYAWIESFRSINSYGLFAVMTVERPEIILSGSDDGRDWKEYEFPYKPGDLMRRPAFVAPYQPRLDWQMWFAALGDYRQNPWLVNFCARLLQGSPDVLALMGKNPFPDHPPKYVRAWVYDYHFTSWAEHRRTGAWWTRDLKGEYLPPISLDMLQQAAAQPPQQP
jgi:predicted DCC family thiol-disulfide oxidoreductase YuxK